MLDGIDSSLLEYDPGFIFCNLCDKDADQMLVCCSSCPRSYHMVCAKLVQVPKGKWNCPACRAKDRCTICVESLEIVRSQPLVRCISCLLFMHIDCLEVSLHLLLMIPKYRNLPHKDQHILHYICYDCQKGLGPEIILDSYNFEHQSSNQVKNNNYYLVKFKGMSYGHAIWVKREDFLTYVQEYVLTRFELKKSDANCIDITEMWEQSNGVNKNYMQVESILNKWVPNPEEMDMTGVRYLVKWRGLNYKSCTWEREEDIEEFKDKIVKYERPKADKSVCKELTNFNKLKNQPVYVTQGKLLNHQLEALNWLLSSWVKKMNAVIADELGLGKTIECLVFLQYLYMERIARSPFLISVNTSNLESWSKHCEIWFPEAYVVTYNITHKSLELIKEKEMYFDKKKNLCKYDILLTTHEHLLRSIRTFQNIDWSVVVLDDISKVRGTQLIQNLETCKIKYRLLLTDELKEDDLDSLLPIAQFILPEKPNEKTCSTLIGSHNNIKEDRQSIVYLGEENNIIIDQRNKLSEELKLHILKRNKKEVFNYAKRNKEIILRVSLSNKQKEMYKRILIDNIEILKQLDKNINILKPVLNLIKTLLLCSDHCSLINESVNTDSLSLIESSRKMKLLDLLLKRFKADKHRVIILTQFNTMVKILEEYFKLAGYKYVTISNRSLEEKYKLITKYNEDNSYFILLASQEMWITVDAADTVIVFDSNLLTSRDIQRLKLSISTRHNVRIYRLVSKDTIEEKIVNLTRKKAMIENSIVKNEKIIIKLLNKILKYGTKKLFNSAESNESTYTTESIDCLFKWHLATTQEQHDYSELVGTFIPSVFVNETESTETNYWHQLLNDKVPEPMIITTNKSKYIQAISITQHLLDSEIAVIPFTISKGQIIITEENKELLNHYCINIEESFDLRTSLSVILWGFHEINRQDFIHSLMKYGVFNYNWKALHDKCKVDEKNSLSRRTVSDFINYGEKFALSLEELVNEGKYDSKLLFTSPYTAKEVIERVAHLVLLRRALNGSIRINSEGNLTA